MGLRNITMIFIRGYIPKSVAARCASTGKSASLLPASAGLRWAEVRVVDRIIHCIPIEQFIPVENAPCGWPCTFGMSANIDPALSCRLLSARDQKKIHLAHLTDFRDVAGSWSSMFRTNP